MGFPDDVRAFKGDYDEWREYEAQWAEILEIKSKLGPTTGFRLLLHFSDLEPSEESTRVHVPRGVKPQVGQHVAYHVNAGDGQNSHIVIDWDKEPKYGKPAPDIDAYAQKKIAEAMASPNVVQPDQVKSLAGQGDGDEMDPQVHLARLEKKRAAGEVTDAEYAEQKANLDAWVANLKRL